MFVDNGRDVKVLVRVDAADDAACHLLILLHAGSPGSTACGRLHRTECLDRTVTRQNVRPFLGHGHRRGRTPPQGVLGGRQVRGRTRVVVDQSAGQATPRRLAAPATLADSSGGRNTSPEEVAMNTRKRRSDWSGRSALRSPGRPTAARREDRQRFWAAIAAGCSSEDAAVGAGVSPAVGARWFRGAGGMPPSHLARSSKPLSGRSLSFAEREEIAILRAREIARRLERAPSTISR